MLDSATRRLERIQYRIDGILMSAFPGWRPAAPRERGWRFYPPDELVVYRASPRLEAIEALRREGFGRVTAHPHDVLAACRCARRATPLPAVPAPGDTSTPASPAPRAGVDPEESDPELLEVEIERSDATDISPAAGSGGETK